MIKNKLFTDTSGLDLKAMIEEYGPPHYPTKRNPVGTLNEDFWAALVATFNEILYENREADFYKYFPPVGIYKLLSSHLLFGQISNDIQAASRDWPGYEVLAQLRNAKHLSGILTHLKGYVQVENAFNIQRDYVHLKNGVLLLSSGSPELVPFDPKLISRNSIPVSYNVNAGCKRFKTELLAPLTADDKDTFQKLFGMYLGGNNFAQKITILEGAPESGKSQLAIVARELIGKLNCAELRIAHLEDRFEIGRFLGKILLIGADVAGDFLSHPAAHKLKGLTGGDMLTCEKKFSNQLLDMAGIFNILITCNSRLVVHLNSDRGAWARRLIIIPYDQKKHAKNIPNFGHILVQNEGSGIVNWALEGLLKLNAEIEEHGELIMTDEQKKKVDSLLDESEGVLHFIKNNVIADPNEDLTTDEIFEEYAIYCADPDRGWYVSRKGFERKLPNVMLQLFQSPPNNNIARNGKKVRGYRNVRFAP